MTLLWILSLLFVLLGIGTMRWQSRASSCPVHSRTAGKVAGIIAYLSIATGMAIFLFALLGR